MSHRLRSVAALVVATSTLSTAAPAVADGLDAYRVKASAKNLKALATAGFDLTEGRRLKQGTIDVVGSAEQISAAKVDARRLSDNPVPRRTLAGAAAIPGASDAAWDVWTKYDAVDGDGKEQYTETFARVLAEFPDITAQRVTGTTYGGREIVAIQVTKDATGADIPGRPAVLYNALQHAREWLAGETCRRTLDYFLDHYGKGTSAGREATALVDSTELWFVCVNNPDGYEFTFSPGNRLWRKNLRDNNNDGQITIGDGVDPNRNFSSNWGRDNDGSSPEPQSETYRGPSPASEPETAAMEALFDEIKPVFQKNDHTAASLLLYPQGYQQDTHSADHEIFTALAGDPFKPAIDGFLPELAAGLYITNGDFTDWAYNTQDTLSFTPEGTPAEDPDVSGFEYPDSEQQIQQEFQRHLPFALDLAKSADDPSEPDSHLDNTAEDFVVDTFADSYGDPQPVQVTLKRKLGAPLLKFRINGGPVKTVTTKPYTGGKRDYKEKGVFYQRYRGFVVGTKPGDAVEAWFEAGGRASGHFSYDRDAGADGTKPVLLLANEDWSGVQPNPAPLDGPVHLDTYKAALDANGVQYDVYDVDAHDRRPPDHLGVLAHYSHVVWFTGDDYVPREPDAPGGSGVSKRAIETQNEVRDFLNDGGRLFFSGANAGAVFGENIYSYNPFQDEEGTYCQNSNPSCIAVQDDFLQYWLGAYRYVPGGGSDENGAPFPIEGTSGAFDALSLTLNGADSAQNAEFVPTLLTTSSVLDPATFPLFADSAARGAWQRPFASPFDPHAGAWFMSAGTDDAAYKRLLKPFTIPGNGGSVKFWTSYDLEIDYDYLFVEIRTVGSDDWTTLADVNGHTSSDVGLSCPTTGDGSNWQANHPFLAHYQTITNGGADCAPTGTSGEWNAATGNSGGWQEWELEIPAAYHGDDVEIAVSVVSDPAVQGLGTWVDELRVVDTNDAPITSSDPSFEAGVDGWTTPGPPGPAGAGGQSSATGWERSQSAPFVETPITTTDTTVYTPFGVESVTGAANRTALVAAALEHLGQPVKPVFDAPAPLPDPPGPDTGGGGPGTGNGPPVPPPTQTKPRRLTRLKFARTQSLRTILARGVLIQLTCDVGCSVRADLTVSPAARRRLRLPSTRIGRRSFSLASSGTKRARVPLTRSAKRRLRRTRRLTIGVRVLQTDIQPAIRRTGRVMARRR